MAHSDKRLAALSVANSEDGKPLPPLSGSAAEKMNHDEENTEVTDEVRFKRNVDELISKVDELEQKVKEVSKLNTNKGNPDPKEKEKQGTNSNSNNNANSSCNNSGTKKAFDGVRTQVVCSKRMQELMRQFGTILRQISQHKWAWPFMEPVDVEGLGLHDYYEVIKKPMDLCTIRNQIDAKDDTGYTNVFDIYADARLVFTNAMTYNDERNDIHVMAKTLLAKLEEKWLLLWPKVVEEEKKQKEEETHALANMQIAHEAAMRKMASDAENELNELLSQLDELREMAVKKSRVVFGSPSNTPKQQVRRTKQDDVRNETKQKKRQKGNNKTSNDERKWSTDEKRKLGAGLSALSTEDLNKALEIIAQSNPNFQTLGDVVEFDMDAQSETTLWRLKFFVKEALEHQAKCSRKTGNDSLKRRQEICDALAKTARNRNRKLSCS